MGLIPRPQMYMDPNIGLGKIADIRHTEVDSAVAAGVVAAGAAVQMSSRAVTTVSDGKFYGVAVAKDYVDNLDDSPQTSKYKAKQMVPVLRKGTINVAITADVAEGQPAAVDGTTGNFKPAADADTIVGTFKTAGKFVANDATAGSTAQLQINLP